MTVPRFDNVLRKTVLRVTAQAATVWLLAMTVFLTPSVTRGRDQGRRAIWPMYRGDPQRTGQSPFAGPLPMRLKWEVDLKREICASPAVGPDGTVYVGAGAMFCAIGPHGRPLWAHNFTESGRYSGVPHRGGATGDNQGFTSPSPALAQDGTIYQACGMGRGQAGQGFVVALDSRPEAENRVRWAFTTNREMRSSPLVAEGTCFVGDCMVLSLDRAGKRKWEGGNAPFSGVTSSPAMSLDGTSVYVGGFDGRLHALDARTGKTIWTAGPEIPRQVRVPQWDAQGRQICRFTTAGYIPDAPAVGPDGTIYFGSWDGYLYAAAPDGNLLWAIDLGDRVTSAPAVAADGRLLVSTYEGTLCAVRVERGKPSVDWRVEANSRYSSPLVSSDGKVYVGGLDGTLRAYALDSGRLLGKLMLGGWIYASPVPGGDGLVYVGASDGYLRAIETGDPESPIGAVDAMHKISSPTAEASHAPGPLPSRTISPEPAATKTRPPSSYAEAVNLGRSYLDEQDAARRAAILRQVDGWSEQLDEIALALRPVPPSHARTGYIREDKFTIPRLRARMERILPGAEGPVLPYIPPKGGDSKGPAPGEEYMNWVHVPDDYDPKRPQGLVIGLHGGAGSSPQSEAGELAKEIADMVGGSGLIVVCPSTPPLVDTHGSAKFQFPESDVHIQSVIEEYSARYAIDPNRVYLMGYSMGGIGSWWQAFRHSDRFAVIAPIAGTWRAAYWPRLRGTLLYVVSGAFDHHTHVDHARYADEQMKLFGIPHIDAEYLGAHARGLARPQQEALAGLFKVTQRDPYCKRACAVSPFVADDEARRDRYQPMPYSFWVSVVEIGDGGLPVDFMGSKNDRGFEGGREGGRPWERKMCAVNRRLLKAGAVDAENLGGNRFRVEVTNVKRFALWLHPKMGIDFAKPIQVDVVHMGVDTKTNRVVEKWRERVTTTARPSLAAMLKYLGDRRDFGLIYHAVVEVDCKPGGTG